MKYFKTDGIRGVVGIDITYSLSMKVGQSLSLFPHSLILIGYDTRESSHKIKSSICYGAQTINKDAIDVGVITTPGLCYLSKIQKSIGIMITASHNPYDHNGIKIFVDGEKLSTKQELQIEDFIDHSFIEADDFNVQLKKDQTYINKYIDFLSSFIRHYHYKLAFDLSNGSSNALIERLFKNKCDSLFLTGNNPNGKNINLTCGSTHIANLANLMKGKDIDIGFSFDGDADRVIAIDEKGNVRDGDQLVFVIAKYLKQHNLLKNNGVVLTVVSNQGVISSLEKLGIKTYLSPVGDKNVFKVLEENNLQLGGESSGHLIQLDKLPSGDGILNAITILNIMQETKCSLSKLCEDIEIYPDKSENIKVKDKDVVNKIEIKEFVDRIIKRYNNIQLVIRASGTEDYVRIYCCYKDRNVIDQIISEVINLIKTLERN